ncbi:MAG: hypothetical protein F6K56_42775, partial [Moorea sp. SIO3G5]|nr:hypothetical protein [Moorena sp. SIO3G5]
RESGVGSREKSVGSWEKSVGRGGSVGREGRSEECGERGHREESVFDNFG